MIEKLRKDDLENVVGLWLHETVGASRPPDIVLALCHLRWPGREFVVEEDSQESELICLNEVKDLETSVSAERMEDAQEVAERLGWISKGRLPVDGSNKAALALVLDYYLCRCLGDEEWFPSTIVAMLRLQFPARRFVPVDDDLDEDEDDFPCYVSDFKDADTGENAGRVFCDLMERRSKLKISRRK